MNHGHSQRMNHEIVSFCSSDRTFYSNQCFFSIREWLGSCKCGLILRLPYSFVCTTNSDSPLVFHWACQGLLNPAQSFVQLRREHILRAELPHWRLCALPHSLINQTAESQEPNSGLQFLSGVGNALKWSPPLALPPDFG